MPPITAGSSPARTLLRVAALLAGLASAALAPLSAARAEGAWQLGLFEGPSHQQPLYESTANRNVLRVDILSPGEVINVHLCGNDVANNVRVEIRDPLGAPVYTPAARACNVSPTSTFDGPDLPWDPAVTNPFQYVAPSAGTYTLRIYNDSGQYLNRYDVTVTDDPGDPIDPREDGGRLWATSWQVNAFNYTEAVSTDADLYVVADGGFTGTYAIWELDLNNFAGFVYTLKANNKGVASPNDNGDVVAGISVPRTGNRIEEQYPIYVAYPEKPFASINEVVIAENFRFLDDQGEDAVISPGASGNFQDQGAFSFTTNIDDDQGAVYEIIIDVGDGFGGPPDGVFGYGDVFLVDNARNGQNSVVWDGRANDGSVVPEGFFTARLRVRIGEFHFVADDAETSGGDERGIRINQTSPGGGVSPTLVYWDDFSVLGSTRPNAFNVTGIYDGDHAWGNYSAGGFGNNRLIDTYAFADTSPPLELSVGIATDDIPRPTVEKSFLPSVATSGDPATMRIAITNNDTADITGITLSDALPDGMVIASDPSAVVPSGAGCTGFTIDPSTVVGGNSFAIASGTVPGSAGSGGGNTVCTVEIDVSVTLPDEYPNITSGVASDQASVGPNSNTARLRVVPGASGASLSCDSQWYFSTGSATSTRLFEAQRAGSTYGAAEFSGAGYAPTAGYSYDALGLNPVDGYLYAVVRDTTPGNPRSGSLLRIDASGYTVNLGRPVQGPRLAVMPATTTRYVGGAFGADGLFYVVTDADPSAPANERSRILGIDVASAPAQVVTNVAHGRDLNDISIHPDGRIFAYSPAGVLFTIDPDTGATTTIGTGAATGVDSQFMDATGALTVRDGAGTLHAVDLDTAQTTVVASGPAGNIDDGASCPYGIAFEKRAASPQGVAGGQVTYLFDVTNGSSSAVSFDLGDTFADGRTFVEGSLVKPVELGGAENAYGGTDTLSLQGLLLGPRSTATVSVDVDVPITVPPGPMTNQATLSNLPLSLGGARVSDDPSTPAFGDPTAVDVIGSAILGVAKNATVSPTNSIEVALDFYLENLGTLDLADVSLPDDLDAVFGAGNYSITPGTPVLLDDPGTLTLNPGFSGTGTGTDLLDPANSTLAAGETAEIRLVVLVDNVTDRGQGRGFYRNQVTASAADPLGGAVADVSDSGTEPDEDGDGDPTESVAGGGDSDENDVTVFAVTETFGPTPPPVALGKRVTDLDGGDAEPGDRLRYTISVDNSLTTPVTDLTVTDELPGPLEAFALIGAPPGTVANYVPGGANGAGTLTVSNLDIDANTGVEIVFEASIIAGAALGTPIDNVAELDYPAGDDATATASISVYASFLPASGTKPLYVTGPTGLSRAPLPADTGSDPVNANGGQRSWTLNPALADAFTVDAGTAPVYLWLTGTVDGDYPVRVDLSSIGASGGAIGARVSRTVNLLAGVPRLVRFDVPVTSDVALAAGSQVRLTLSNDHVAGLRVTARNTGTHSRVELDSSTVIDVGPVETLDDAFPDGAPRALWYANETLHVRSTISDPFGAADISDALVSVRDGDGNEILAPTSMGAPVAGTAGTRTYDYAWTLPATVQPGTWRVVVRGEEGTEGTVTHSNFVDITVRQAPQDHGDAPDGAFGTAPGDYRTRLEDDGPRHGIDADLRLGAELDAEADGLGTAPDATGDDVDGVDDEDGVAFTTELAPGLAANAAVEALNATGAPAYLNAWVDFDADGDFGGPGEQIAADLPLASGTASLDFAVPAGSTIGATVARFRYSTQTGLGPNGAAADGEVEDHAVTITVPGYTLSGRVFEDRDVDGAFGTGDVGIAGASVVLRAVASGTCISVRTRGDGTWFFYPVLDGDYTVHESVGAAVPSPGACPPASADPSGYLSVTPNERAVTVAGGDLAGLDFADVREPTLTGDGTGSAEPGGAAVYPHAFTAQADGSVDFALASSPAGSGTLYRDVACDGRLDAADPVLAGTVTVAAGDRVCLLVRSAVASNAGPGARQVDTLTASYAFADPAGLGHGLSSVRRRQDVTEATARAAGRLVLGKTVENASEGGARSLTNAADTGDVLRYTVRFENTGTGALTELRINDATPAFTATSAPVTCPGALPPGLGPCTVRVPAAGQNAAGYSGLIEWDFAGELVPGGAGELSFEVEIE